MKTNNEKRPFPIREGQFWVHQFYKRSQEQKSIFVSYLDLEKELLIMKKYEKGVSGVVDEIVMKFSTVIKLLSENHPRYKNQSKFFYKLADYPAFMADDKYIIEFYNKLKEKGGC